VYLKKIRLQNIKCFEDVTLEFPHKDGDYSGWNVILGENGAGKTAILRAIAVGTLNLFQDGRPARDGRFALDERWVRAGQTKGLVHLDIQAGEMDHPNHPFKPANHKQVPT
jgi:DNA repair exonuclease SbcCD ATPase subunit